MEVDSIELNKTATCTSIKLDTINKLLNYYLDIKTPIIIKTCQVMIKTNIEKYPLRPGRFMFNLKDYHFAIENNAIFIFVVKDKDVIKACKVIKAEMIPYRRFWQWNKLIYRKVD